MKVAIVGSRDYPNLYAVLKYVASLPEGAEVVTGGARGVDRHAEKAALVRHDIDLRVFPANWTLHGRGAGYIRNQEIVDYVKQDRYGRVVAFWDGKSSGTRDTIRRAKKASVPVTVYGPDGKEMAV